MCSRVVPYSGSRAEATIGRVCGTDATVSRSSTGSREVTSQEVSSTAIEFSMIVVMTSWAPVLALR